MVALHIHFFLAYYLSKKYGQYTHENGFETYKRMMLLWAYETYVMLTTLELQGYMWWLNLPFSPAFILFLMFLLPLYMVQTYEMFGSTMYYWTMDYWESNELELYIIYLSSIKSNFFNHHTKDDWFNNQLTGKMTKGFKVFSFLMLILTIMPYIFFMYAVTHPFKIHPYMPFTHFLLFLWHYYFVLVIMCFLFMLLSSICNIPNTWLLLTFEFHVPGYYFDCLQSMIFWYNTALETGDAFYQWEIHPFYLILERMGDKNDWFVQGSEYWPGFDSGEMEVASWWISSEWSVCYSPVFDCYVNNYVFKFWYFISYMVGAIYTTSFLNPEYLFYPWCMVIDLSHWDNDVKQYMSK